MRFRGGAGWRGHGERILYDASRDCKKIIVFLKRRGAGVWKCGSMGVWESVCNDFSMAVTTTVENAVASVIVSVCDIGTSCEDSGRQTIDDANRRESTEIDRHRRELGRFQPIDVDSCRFLSPSDPREARCKLGLPANSTPGREANKVKSGALGDRAPPRGGRAVGATECGALGDRAPPRGGRAVGAAECGALGLSCEASAKQGDRAPPSRRSRRRRPEPVEGPIA